MVENGEEVFEFLIKESNEKTKMKNINHISRPNFHGLTIKDPQTFLFEFEVVCRTYDYTLDARKLKLFPSSLKCSYLICFMSLEGNIMEYYYIIGSDGTNLLREIQAVLKG